MQQVQVDVTQVKYNLNTRVTQQNNLNQKFNRWWNLSGEPLLNDPRGKGKYIPTSSLNMRMMMKG